MKPTTIHNTLVKTKIEAQFLAEVEFGMPSKQCRHFGICNINPIRWRTSIKEQAYGAAIAVLTVFNSQYIELDFIRESLSLRTFQKHLSPGTFMLEEAYHFVKKEKDIPCFTIKKGEYPIDQNEHWIKVICPVHGVVKHPLPPLNPNYQKVC